MAGGVVLLTGPITARKTTFVQTTLKNVLAYSRVVESVAQQR